MAAYHTVVIGAGSGGLTAAVGLAKFGKRVALVERGRIGGDCTNVGCIPSKTLIDLAKAYAQRSPGAPGTPADVLAAVRAKRDRLRRREEREFRAIDGLDVIDGWGRVAGANLVEVTSASGDRRELAARYIVLATGSRPAQIEIPGLPEALRHTNESIFELDRAPEHIAIVGAGATGCELAFAFRRLGSRVTLLEAQDRALPAAEPDVGALLRDRFREEGIDLRARTRPEGWRAAEGASDHRTRGSLLLAQGGASETVDDVDAVLIAVGRTPNLDDVGLGSVELEAAPAGMATDGVGRTSVSSIFVIGDANARSASTHEANAQGRRLVQKLAFPWLPVGSEGIWPQAIFTDPEIAWVGQPRAALEARIHAEAIRTIRIDLAETDRAYTMGLDRGFLVVNATRLTGRMLSATVVGPHASEMLPLLTHAVNGGPRLYGLANHVYAYPTLMEAVKKAADAFQFETLDNLADEIRMYARHRFRSPEGRRGQGGGA